MEKLTMASLLPPQFPAFLMQSLQNLPNLHGITMPCWRLAVNAQNVSAHRWRPSARSNCQLELRGRPLVQRLVGRLDLWAWTSACVGGSETVRDA